MKRILRGFFIGVLVIGCVSSVSAADKKAMKNRDKMRHFEACRGESGDVEMMGPGKIMEMRNLMVAKSIIATSDGGVIVLIGNKLQKYDKDLVLQKEVPIKADVEGVCETMTQMKGKCPMQEQKARGEITEKTKK